MPPSVNVNKLLDDLHLVDMQFTVYVAELRHCDFWVGATDQEQEGTWRWVQDNTLVTYANWNHNEPNNGSGDEHCAMMLWVFNWSWNDARCKYDNACYICQTTMQEE